MSKAEKWLEEARYLADLGDLRGAWSALREAKRILKGE